MNRQTEVFFRTVESQWDDEVANKMDPVGRLVYRSNLIGSDAYINNTGGGNTSSKIIEKDPITNEDVEVLWVKGSGGDLRTSKRVNFASLYQDRLIALQKVYDGFDVKGPKTPAEDKMVAFYTHCTFNLNSRAPSIDTPLHSFVPYKYVDHTHPVPCIAIATADNGKELTKKIYGDEVVWVDWLRPGFELGLKLQETIKNNPGIRGIILGGHGLINWANDDKECYLTSLELINRAAEYLAKYEKGADTFGGCKYQTLPEDKRDTILYDIMPFIRGQISQEKRLIGTVQYDDTILEFINSVDAPRLAEVGTSCPDHFLRTKIKPMYIGWNPQEENLDALRDKITSGLDQYRKDYQTYYETNKVDDSPAIRNPNPSVILVPGVGMITWGKTKSESRVTAEFYNAAVGVMRGAESVNHYTALPQKEAFDIEYWALEEAKLRRMPPEKELSRKIIAVVGAGSGIGKEVVSRLITGGATVAALDLDEKAAEATANEKLQEIGMGIGIAGSGISGSGDVIGIACNITDRDSVKAALNKVIKAYGGLDNVVVTAGLYATPDKEGRVPDTDWDKSFAVNVKGNFLIADEANRIWQSQGLNGSMVITTSVNAVVAKRGSLAYDTTKAAANHLIRELAIDLAPLVRVNGVAPATVVEGSGMFPRDRVIASLSKYGIEFDDSDETEVLRSRLMNFYATRTLTKRPITLQQQSEAVFLLISNRLENTTGQVIPVDGGIIEAFMR